MTEKYTNTITILTFCSAFTDFLIITPADYLYPRDRIVHIMISSAIFLIVAQMINKIDFNKLFFKFTAVILLSARLVLLVVGYSGYFRIFYGNSTVGIAIFTALILFMAIRLRSENISLMGDFYISVNILMFVLLMFSLKNISASNICSVNSDFIFSLQKLFVFFDVFTISVALYDKNRKWQIQKRFVAVSTAVFILISFFQGFCIKGDMLYSISPLQSLLQIFSGNTVKRYDYIFNLFFAFNYFGAVILYSVTLKKLFKSEIQFENN